MKKIFTLACAVAAIFGVSTTASAAEKVLASELDAQQATLSSSIKANSAAIDAAAQNRADEDEGEWVKVSTGIWFEGPLAATYTDVDNDQWEVDIYQNEAKPGVIRLNPYGADTPPSKLIGRANTAELEINISNPAKCYFLDWVPYNMIIIGSYCTENEWNATNYGTLADGVVTFPSGTVLKSTNGQNWSLVSGDIKIVLDKDAFVDYTVTAEAPFCGTAANSYVQFTKSDAIAKVKVAILDGEYPMNDKNAKVVANQGDDVTSYVGKKVNFGLTGPNTLYSVLYVGLDADDNIQDQGVIYTYVVEDDAANWKALGEAVYTEGLICEFFNDIDSEDLTCVIEENVSTPGYYRLVNPYAKSEFAAKENHNHYLYIDATNPEKVVVEPSALGVYINANFGYAAAQSWGYYLGEGTQADNYNVWGKMADGEITVPAFRLQLSKYSDGKYLNITSLPATDDTKSPFKVVISVAAPAHDIEGVNDDNTVELKDGQDITLTAGEGHDIYFAWEEVKAEEDPQALTQNRMPADEDFVILPAEAEGKVTFEAENNGDQKYLHFYAKNTTHGGKSPVTSILITRNGSTGVENVNASEAAPVEYFNLQGIRIDNPANGQVVIRRQGNEVVKIVK